MNIINEIITSIIIINITIYLCPQNDNNSILIISSIGSMIILIQTTQLFNISSWEYYLNLIYITTHNNIPIFTITVDNLSASLILLTSFLIFPCLLISNNNIYHSYNNFTIYLLITNLILIFAFLTSNLLLFFILFESSIIPISLIIGNWGSRNENIQATYYFFIYTITGSLPLFISILYLYNIYNTFNTQIITNTNIHPHIQLILFLGFFFAFAINTPLIPWHTWLPLAHVEAPAIGSVILAGILLNLGSYGFIRFTLELLPNATSFLSPLIITLSILSIWYASLNSLRQNDLNRIIAYSSIAHMGLITATIFSNNSTSNTGSTVLIIAHGLTSAALFILISCIYERHNTRNLTYYRGLISSSPIYSTNLLIITLAHMNIPGSLNFIGEYQCLLGLWENNPITSIISIPSMILTTCYLLFLYIRLICSISPLHIQYNRDLNLQETMATTIIIIPTIIIGVFPNLINNMT